MIRWGAATFLVLTLIVPAAHAADHDSDADTTSAPRVTISLPVVAVPKTRPAILTPLYVSFVGLQAYDIYSTRPALTHGGSELNPLVSPFSGDTAGMIALKALSTATSIAMAERLWHKNRTAAIVTMVVANGVMAAVAANNARVLRQLH